MRVDSHREGDLLGRQSVVEYYQRRHRTRALGHSCDRSGVRLARRAGLGFEVTCLGTLDEQLGA